MLRGASEALAHRCRVLTSVAGSARSLQALDAAIANRDIAHHMLALDWRTPGEFVAAITNHARATGSPDLVLAWLHDDALGPRLAAALASTTTHCAFFQVRGSAAANPAEAPDSLLRDSAIPAAIDFHQIILGFHLEAHGSRWLHDEEICAGVLAAINHPQSVTLVGTATPWSHRP